MPGYIPTPSLTKSLIMARYPMVTRLEDKLSEARALKECLYYLHPIATEQEFVLCAQHILQARDAAKVLEEELARMLRDMARSGASGAGEMAD
jgi:hypothetical protein